MVYNTFLRSVLCRCRLFAYIFFEDFFDLFFVVFICGTDEFVVGCVHQIPDSFDLTGYVVYEFFLE